MEDQIKELSKFGLSAIALAQVLDERTIICFQNGRLRETDSQANLFIILHDYASHYISPFSKEHKE